jgi:RHS repeat-associated protein
LNREEHTLMKYFGLSPVNFFSLRWCCSIGSRAIALLLMAIALLGGATLMPNLAHAAKKTVHFYNDIAGTPQMAVDAVSGQVLWKETYRPYGERINNSPASATGKGQNELYFHGKQAETLNNGVTIQYFGARYTMPGLTDRFTSVDPVHFVPPNVHTFNRFAFASNNPYRFTDPDGNQSMPMAHDPRLFAQQAWTRFSAAASAAREATIDLAVGLVPGSAAYACASGGCGAVGWGLASLDVAGPAGKAVGKAGKAAGAVTHEATGFMGRSGNELVNATVQKTRNEATEIGGRQYSAHALDQMQNRGVVPSVVENTISTGSKYATRAGTTGHYDSVNNMRVITNSEKGNVVTVIPGAP